MRTKDLSVGYNKKTVLSLIDLVFENGKFISLLGPNGAGKTTLLRTMARLLPPCDGSVLIDQISLNEFKQDSLARILSVVLTDRVSPGLFSVFEFVALGRYPHTGLMGRLKKSDEEVIISSLAQVNAGDLVFRQVGTLSDGERQKVLLARALTQEPRLILLDEPTIHLDLKHRMEVISILQKLCREKGITVVASMHDVDIAAKISDSVVLIKNGRIAAWGPPEETLDNRSVAALYDFEGASFNPGLGSIEIKADGGRGSVFVAGGMARGAALYRLLAKRGLTIATGIIHDNDLDCYVAKSLGAECITLPPMEKIGQNKLNEALPLIKQADYTVDSGFPLGEFNRMNAELIKYALTYGKPVFTLRKAEDAWRFLQTDSENMIVCENEIMLLNKMDGYQK